MLSKNWICYYRFVIRKLWNLSRSTLNFLRGNKGLKTLLESVLRSVIGSKALEQISDKSCDANDLQELHEPQTIMDCDTKTEIFFLKIIAGNKGANSVLDLELFSDGRPISSEELRDKNCDASDSNLDKIKGFSIIFACLCVLERFSSVRGLRCMQDPKKHQIWVF